MKSLRPFCILFLLFLPAVLLSQEVDLEAFNTERLELNRQGMLVLGSWSVANMGLSAFYLNHQHSEVRAYHQMNLGWNAINLIIAGIGYYSSIDAAGSLSLLESVQEHERMRNILLFNAGLDVAYMAGGIYLLERSKNSAERRDQFSGFGKAVIVNGAFLFCFDLILAYVHGQHGNASLYSQSVALLSNANGIGLSFRF